MTPSQPFALRVFVPSGIPEGLRIVEKSNWSGIGFVVPRSQLAEFIARPEAQRPGVYVLLGPEADGSGELAYIGEADPLGRRLEQHAASRDFWTTAFAFTDKDNHLNKAHGLHLEARLIELAREARRCKLDNLQQGRSISLSEVDRAEAEGYLSELLLCCPVLGLRLFPFPGGRHAARSHRQRAGRMEGRQRTEPARAPSTTGEVGWRAKLGLASITS